MTYNVFSGTLNPTHFTCSLQYYEEIAKLHEREPWVCNKCNTICDTVYRCNKLMLPGHIQVVLQLVEHHWWLTLVLVYTANTAACPHDVTSAWNSQQCHPHCQLTANTHNSFCLCSTNTLLTEKDVTSRAAALRHCHALADRQLTIGHWSLVITG